MRVSQLTSRGNSLLKTIRLVASGARGAPGDLAIAEGIRVLEEVNNAGCEIKAVVFSERFGASPREQNLLDAWLLRGAQLFKVSDDLFESVSSVQTPQGALALIRVPDRSLAEILPVPNALILYALGIQDPGNLGTLFRTAAAAGATLVCTAQGTVSARNPKVIRSSAGISFRLPLVEHVAVADFRAYCHIHSIQLYRTDARQGMVYTHADFRSPCAILLGNEGSGIDEKQFDASPAIRIPMANDVESLNVAMAGAIILFEASRQRLSL
jgi:TrmH family RNA methyltransferase